MTVRDFKPILEEFQQKHGDCPYRDMVFEYEAEVQRLSQIIIEYEHALGHVVECGRCPDCQRLATFALDTRTQ
jgi:hypothetical protein